MIFLGIDGGGSKTSFLLEDEEGRELARFQTGPSNWLSSGSINARESLTQGIRRLPLIPDVVCGGFAGAGRPEGVEFYRRCLSALLPDARLLIETDAFVTYMGAIGPKPGVLLIAGTGSIALALNSSGKMIRAGGWGPTFSDEGGGFWIGQEAIRAALRALDAGDAPEFVSTIEKALGVNRITDVPAAWKDGAIHVRSVAALASTITNMYPAEPAKRILDDAALHLRNLCELAREHANLPPACVRSIAGSIGALPLMQQSIGLQFSPPDNPPAKGAILWARDRLSAS